MDYSRRSIGRLKSIHMYLQGCHAHGLYGSYWRSYNTWTKWLLTFLFLCFLAFLRSFLSSKTCSLPLPSWSCPICIFSYVENLLTFSTLPSTLKWPFWSIGLNKLWIITCLNYLITIIPRWFWVGRRIGFESIFSYARNYFIFGYF